MSTPGNIALRFTRVSSLPKVLAAIIVTLAPAASLTSVAEDKTAPAITIHNEPLNDGKVSPLLFGNFIELLDDVVPAMWAEMLNDRSFEGILPPSPQHYFNGAPDICDRPWDKGATWDIDTDRPFSGARCAKLSVSAARPATLTQSSLAVKTGVNYHFTGYLRAEGAAVNVAVALKTLLPDGTWMTLASVPLPKITDAWQKVSVSMTSCGVTDRAVFALEAQGDGHLWADKLSLMPEDNVHGWRRDVVDLVKELHPPIIRWGGSIIDPGEYRWKNAVGDRDQRLSFQDKVWGRLDSNDVGIDEFCQFCEAVGAESLICTSLSDGAESAGELVQYCNGDAVSAWGSKRAANGHPEPYRVKYWQVGNEIAGDRADYLEQIENFIHAIKQADSAAQVMSSYPAQKLVDLAGRDLAFVCPHEYTRDLARAEAQIRNTARMFDTAPGCEHLKIAITEWNVSGGDWGVNRARQMTLETALLNARHLHVMMRHCDKVGIANRSNMANSYCGATFETSPAGILKRPSHYVMELYTHHARPMPLKVESGPGDHAPDVFACASPDKKSVTLFAVNTADRAQEFRVASDGFERPLRIIRAEAVCDTQDAKELDVMNHWTAPDRVKTVALKASGETVTLPALSAVAIEVEAKE